MAVEHFDDPVAAYDRLAPAYPGFAQKRQAYLRSVEEQIIARIPSGANSLLDIGAGDGSRAQRIASAAGIARVVLLEPSLAMSRLAKSSVELWRMRAEELYTHPTTERFDTVTCLWNVLGHVRSMESQKRALKTFAELLSPQGRLFLDVNHRYNAPSYGWIATCARWVRDVVMRDFRAGDVTAAWNIGDCRVSSYGHVFTHREIISLSNAAGLEMEERLIIDYDNGSLHRSSWLGNLLYVLRRSS